MNIESIFNIKNNIDFEKACIDVFNFQYNNNIVYKTYVDLININPKDVINVKNIPFLPISFFKSHKVTSFSEDSSKMLLFKSSGTTGMKRSQHIVKEPEIYKKSFINCFSYFFCDIKNYIVIAILPSYQDNPNSSLIYMVDEFIKLSNHKASGYYSDDYNRLNKTLKNLKKEGNKILIIGVSFALLDWGEQNAINLKSFNNLIMMETGGMKGKRKEITRSELHHQLQSHFNISQIYSEYGMSELLSQAYSMEKEVFSSPPWMRIMLREVNDPLSNLNKKGKTGGVNIIDLANVYSCSFIATQDLGRLHGDETFEILGRFDNSDIRGCNLLTFNS